MFEILSQYTQSYPQNQGPLGISMIYWIIMGGSMLLSFVVSSTLKSRFKKFSQIPIRMTGAQVAAKMLADSGISDVKIISTPGQLTDHYNPQNKTVNLSEVVHSEANVSAAAVAAHEVGHAVQHARAYSWLGMRSALVPVVSFGSKLAPMAIMAGFFLQMLSPAIGNMALLIGIILFGASTLFAFVTLPVEFDASNRALAWIGNSGVMGTMERSKAKSALDAAAMTYVVGALASLAQLAYYVMIFLNRRD